MTRRLFEAETYLQKGWQVSPLGPPDKLLPVHTPRPEWKDPTNAQPMRFRMVDTVLAGELVVVDLDHGTAGKPTRDDLQLLESIKDAASFDQDGKKNDS